MVAAIRPDAWNFPLFVHVAGAMLLVGALVVVVATMAGALRRGDGAEVLTGLAFRTLLIGVLPAYILMRGGAEWIGSKEDVPDDVDWIGIGYSVADGGLLLTIIARDPRLARGPPRRRRTGRHGPRRPRARRDHDRRLRRRDLGDGGQARVVDAALRGEQASLRVVAAAVLDPRGLLLVSKRAARHVYFHPAASRSPANCRSPVCAVRSARSSASTCGWRSRSATSARPRRSSRARWT